MRSRALPFQHPEVIAVISGSLAMSVAFLDGFSDRFTDGTARTAIGVLPIQTVMLSRGADDLLSELIDSRVVVYIRGVFLLRLHEATAYLDSIEFVGSDSPEENFLSAFCGIEIPLSLLLYDGNGKRPIILANRKHRLRLVVGIEGHEILLMSLGGKVDGNVVVLNWVGRCNEILSI